MIRIIIADDHQMFIDGIKELLEKEPTISIVGEALNGKELLSLLKNHKADIVLMDISMPVMDGVDATKAIRKDYPEIKIIMLTMYNTKQYISQMIHAGASGYILKNTGKNELIKAIQAVSKGESFYSQQVTERVMESLKKKTQQNSSPLEITRREKEILNLLAEDITALQIANRLNISHFTVETHRKNLLSKFNARTTVGLVRMAIEKGLIE